MPILRNALIVAASALLLPGCALIIPQTEEMRQHRPEGLASQAEITEAPFFPQKDYQCGPAALATSLAHFGAQVTPEDLVSQVYLPERRGSLQIEMLASARRNGLVAYKLAPRFDDVLREVAAGFPVIILQDYGVWPLRYWHYAVVVGYDMKEGRAVLRSGEKRRLVIPYAVLEYTWKESEYWAMVTAPPGRIPVTASETSYLKAVIAVEGTGNKEAARTAYAAMLERWPESIGAGIGLANMHYALGDLRQAESVLRLMVERHPDAAVAYNNLAQTVLDQGRSGEALQLAQRALALAGDDGPIAAAARDTLASALSKVNGGGDSGDAQKRSTQ